MTRPDLRGVGDAKPRGYDGFGGVVSPRADESVPWWPTPHGAPAGAPNVVVVLVDDMGFSDVSPFGGEIDTPAVQALAEAGYRFSGFHATPLCSPSRAALLTGANPHRAGYGYVVHADPGFPGFRMLLPDDLPTLAESFHAGGYATFMVGKWHLTRESLMHDGADRSSWPVQRGFDHYFGCMDGFTTLYHPHRLVRDNTVVTEQFADDAYLTDRLTDEALGMIDAHRASNPSAPFFLYFAHHAVHGPVQAKPADIEKYRGRYDRGWDVIREERFARQVHAGLFPDTAQVSPSDPADTMGVPAWNDLDDDRKALFARHMEVYAAAVDAVDQSLARLVAHLKDIGEYDNTIIVFASDNGGTGEGGIDGTRSYFSRFVDLAGLPADWVADVPRPLDELGGPRVHGHYPRGWAHVSNTPFRLYKGSVYEGGVHTPLIVSWPQGMPRAADDDGIRRRFAYITDIAPTLLELAGVPRPDRLRGVEVAPADGVSLASLLRTPDRRPDADHHDQYLAHMSQRAFFAGRFKAVAPDLPDTGDDPATWQLYDIAADPAEVVDIAAAHPDVVADLAERWRKAAWHNTVFPLATHTMLSTRPATERALAQPVTLRPGTPTLERWRSARLTRLRSFTVDAAVSGGVADGVLFSHGDQGGGYVVYAEDGDLCLSYNAYGDMHRVHATAPTSATRVVARFDALPDVAWRIRVDVDGTTLLQIPHVPMLVGMSPFTGISVGFDGGGPVDWALHTRHGTFPYTGTLHAVTYTPGPHAAYDDEIIAAIDDAGARLLD